MAFALPADGLVAVVGTSYRQDVLRTLPTTSSSPYLGEVGGRARYVAEDQIDGRWFRAALRPEPENEHDPNAIAVDAESAGQVGYLSRDDALAYTPVFAALRTRGVERATCPAYLVGEEKAEQTLGVMLCLSKPEEILRSLA
jgi:HIRAN domain